ncbi:PIN domain-containing protein [Flavobacterium sp.]|uniref:PIN domain-containing protein n=1 Tax=Flavobacterium sp. TaxID=239 RepID=UPI001B6A231A|nr:PIN domain-containing protein [Flavobacterium sp.]MBP6127419.1 DUF4935 domain-containing protein [Flavobacterium sp.]
MKKKFIGFYDPTEQEIEDAWTNGVFAFDANTLLNLYRYTDVTRKDFLHVLKFIKENLFIPFQVAFEYLNNRIKVIDDLEKSYIGLEQSYNNIFQNNLKTAINNYKRHPSIEIQSLLKQNEDFLNKISLLLEKQKKKHPDFKTKDYILDELTLLFECCIGKEPLKSDLKKIYEEGKERYLEEIPPGYKDLKEKEKKGQRHLYGDLLIWKELIEYSKRNKKPLIFVTDDGKDDWWKKENGITIRPREELIKEFYDLTGIRILIYNSDQFLKFAKQRGLVTDLKDKTIEEIKDIRISDEARNEFLGNISSLGSNTLIPLNENTSSLMQNVQHMNNLNYLWPNELYETIAKINQTMNDTNYWKGFGDLSKTIQLKNNININKNKSNDNDSSGLNQGDKSK